MKTIFAAVAVVALAGPLSGCIAPGPHAPQGQTQGDYAVRNWDTLTIALERTPCFGFCPDYRVEVHGDGTVVYEGRNFVQVKGRQTKQIPQAEVRKLLAAFEAAGFFKLRDEYTASVTDMPTHRMSLAFDGRNKTVTDYAGRMAEMPDSVSKLEELIDVTAGTSEWIGNGGR